MTEKLNVLAIAHGRDFFEDGSPNLNRMIACSEGCQSHHMVVFTHQKDNLSTKKINSKLTLYPTSAKTRIGMIIKAVTIGLSILRQSDKSDRFVVTTQDPFESGLVGLFIRLKTKVPLNVQVHGDFFSHPYWRREQLFNRVRHFMGIFVLRRADSIRVVAERIAEDLLKRGIKSNRIHNLPVLIDVDDFAVVTPRRFDNDVIKIINVGRFVPQKNLPLLIEAFNLAVAEVPNLRLTMVGSGPEQDLVSSLIGKSKNKDKITVLPWSNDVPTLLEEADIFALSSDYEGRARILVEAMAAGLPIATTDISGVSDVCQPGVHALITPPRDPKAFTEALITLAKDTEMRKRFSQASIQAAKTSTQNISEYTADWVKILNQTV